MSQFLTFLPIFFFFSFVDNNKYNYFIAKTPNRKMKKSGRDYSNLQGFCIVKISFQMKKKLQLYDKSKWSEL